MVDQGWADQQEGESPWGHMGLLQQVCGWERGISAVISPKSKFGGGVGNPSKGSVPVSSNKCNTAQQFAIFFP